MVIDAGSREQRSVKDSSLFREGSVSTPVASGSYRLALREADQSYMELAGQ